MKTTFAIHLATLVAAALAQPAHAEQGPTHEIQAAAGVMGGVAVQIGCGPSQVAGLMALHAGGKFLVQGLDADPACVDRARAAIRAAGSYGPISVVPWADPSRLPYADNLVNVLVVRLASGEVSWNNWVRGPCRRMYWAYGQVVGQYLVFRGDTGYAVRIFEANSREGGFNSGEGYVVLAGQSAERQLPGQTLYALPTDQSAWRIRVPLRPQAMAVAGDRLLLAGPPDVPHPPDALASLEGRQGGLLWLLSTADGRRISEWKLDSPPVYDGLAVAGGRLYWSGMDGRMRCWAEGSE